MQSTQLTHYETMRVPGAAWTPEVYALVVELSVLLNRPTEEEIEAMHAEELQHCLDLQVTRTQRVQRMLRR